MSEEETARHQATVDRLVSVGEAAYDARTGGGAIARWEACMVAVAAEVLADPVRWARALGLPEPETYGECPDCLYDRGPRRGSIEPVAGLG